MRLKFTILFLWLLGVGLHVNVAGRALHTAHFLPASKCNFQKPIVVSHYYIDQTVKDFVAPNTVNPSVFQLVSHGKSGALYLNGAWRDAKGIVSFLQINHVINGATKHLNIYGCEFAKGAKGKAAMSYLERHLGISVAASNNITGIGGDWILEEGKQEDVWQLTDYQYNLQYTDTSDFDGDGIANGVDLDDDNDGVLDAVEKPCIPCNEAYPFGASRVVWTPFTNGASTVTGYVTKNNLTDTVVATSTKFFQSADPTNFFGTGTGAYSGCQNGVSSLPNSALSIYTSSYTVTITFSKPVYNPGMVFSSFDQSNVTFPQPVYIIGMQGTIPTVNIGNYMTSIPGTENLYSIVYPGVYTQISFTVPGNDHQGSIILYCDQIMPPGTPTHVDPAYSSCRDVDADNDGILNRFDLDSDGDGCPDATEGGDFNKPGVIATAGNVKNGNNGVITSTVSTPNALINGPFGSNGFSNILQSASDTNAYKYTYTYDPYALFKALNLCSDVDNDGVSDVIDIDADNDGVLNATECPSCFYKSTELINTISTDLLVNGTNIPDLAIDNNAATISSFNGASAQSWVGKSLFRIGTHFPVAVSAMQLDLSTWALSSSAANTFKFQGSADGVTWSDLSAPMASTATTGTFSVANTLLAGTLFSFYRLVGVAGNNYYGGVSELRLIPADYVPSLHPKETATLNTTTDIDNDGIYNYLDLDSDGDGCPDASEAGTFNQSGVTAISGSVKNGSGGAVTSTTSTANGIPDLVDIDDDNDGIVDAIESPACYYTATEAVVIKKVSTGATSTVNSVAVGSGADIPTLHNTTATSVAAENHIVTAGQTYTGLNIYTIELPTAANLSSVSVIGATASWATVSTATLKGSNDLASWSVLMSSPLSTVAGATKTFTVNQNAGEYKYYRIEGVSASATNTAFTNFEVTATLNTASYIASAHPKAGCVTDTDGDGIPNNNDLDSDGDGCSDAFEGNATTNKNVSSFTTAVGVNGLVNVLETAVDNGSVTYVNTYSRYAKMLIRIYVLTPMLMVFLI